MGFRNMTPADEVAIVYCSKVQFDEEDHAVVTETMHTPFEGAFARTRAEGFMASESKRDFTEADGWQWFVWSSYLANKRYGEEMTRAMLGED